MPKAGPDAEPDLQILTQLNIGDEGRDGPDVKEAVLPKADSIYMPEASSVHFLCSDWEPPFSFLVAVERVVCFKKGEGQPQD
ncbi:X antigen family member 2-like [Pteropus vampyrus]|uniref:X antigen family member 2-like n=1 Tax=Pteropus vampyrus TaxID=132908 RepID=A0A6P3S5J3_PTEVA|nr:X antigen family member 2-like [Pteropus vampyrus]XP_023382746.1 X antigen family member 2-like [Pteropus vampyrus]XP_023382747.1 X antigen family member 2-like [Pteropus vampyrus]